MLLQHPVLLSLIAPFLSAIELSQLICTCPSTLSAILSNHEIDTYVVNLEYGQRIYEHLPLGSDSAKHQIPPSFTSFRHIRDLSIQVPRLYTGTGDHTDSIKLYLTASTLASASPVLESIRLRLPYVCLSFIEGISESRRLSLVEKAAWKSLLSVSPQETDFVRWIPLKSLFTELQHLEISDATTWSEFKVSMWHSISFLNTLPSSLQTLDVDFLSNYDIIDHLPPSLTSWSVHQISIWSVSGADISRPALQRPPASIYDDTPFTSLSDVVAEARAADLKKVSRLPQIMDRVSPSMAQKILQRTQLRRFCYAPISDYVTTFNMLLSTPPIVLPNLHQLTHLELGALYITQIKFLPRGLIYLRTGIHYPPDNLITALTIGESEFASANIQQSPRRYLCHLLAETFASLPSTLQTLELVSLSERTPSIRDTQGNTVSTLGEPLQFTEPSFPPPSLSMPTIPQGRVTKPRQVGFNPYHHEEELPDSSKPGFAPRPTSILTVETLCHLPASLTRLQVLFNAEAWLEDPEHAATLFERLFNLRHLALSLMASEEAKIAGISLLPLSQHLESFQLRSGFYMASCIPNMETLCFGLPKSFLRFIEVSTHHSMDSSQELIDGSHLISTMLRHFPNLRHARLSHVFLPEAWFHTEAPAHRPLPAYATPTTLSSIEQSPYNPIGLSNDYRSMCRFHIAGVEAPVDSLDRQRTIGSLQVSWDKHIPTDAHYGTVSSPREIPAIL